MAVPYQGGCQCGQIRYEVRVEPLTLYVCHCTECQRQSASAFGMSMLVPREGVVMLQGEPKHWSRTSASGRDVICAFCGECGTRLFHLPTRNPDVINIKPGSLDDTSWLRPVAHVWTRSAQAWVGSGTQLFSTELLNIQEQPTAAEFLLLTERFSRAMSRSESS